MFKIVDPDTIHLTTNFGKVVLTYVGSDSFDGTFDGRFYELSPQSSSNDYTGAFELVDTDFVTAQRRAVGLFGFETPESFIGVLASAMLTVNYSGDARVMTVVNGTSFAQEDGTASIDVEFETGTVSGYVFRNGGSVQLDIDGSVSGNDFSGTLSNGGFGTFVVNAGDASGTFFGVEATEVLGTFGGTGIDGADSIEFSGGFFTNCGC